MDKSVNPRVSTNMCMHQLQHQVAVGEQQHPLHQVLPSSEVIQTQHQLLPSSQMTPTLHQAFPSSHTTHTILQTLHQALPSCQTIHQATVPTPTTQSMHQVLPTTSQAATHCVHQTLTQTTHSLHQVLPPVHTTQSIHQEVPPSAQTTHCRHQMLPSSLTTQPVHQVVTSQPSDTVHHELQPSQVTDSLHQVFPSSETTPSVHQVFSSSLTTQAMLDEPAHPQVSQYFSHLSRPACVTTSNAASHSNVVSQQFDQSFLRFDGSLADASTMKVGVQELEREQEQQQQTQQQEQQLLQQQQPSLEQKQQQQQQQQQLQQPVADIQCISNMINEKMLIYRHPLFPLLRILFEKCEVATNSIDALQAITFDNEIKAFITEMARENKPFFTEDAEVDALMLKSLQVLRIHMLELEKVNELCKDFCSRYISCLRGKLNSDNIMKTLEINTSPPSSPSQQLTVSDGGSVAQDTPCNETQNSPVETFKYADPKPLLEASLLDCSDANSMNSVLMQADAPKCSSTRPKSCVDSIIDSVNGIPVSELTSGFLSKKNKCGKRGVLPKQATNVMKAWLFQHLVHPYPSEEEKKQLAEQTNLSNLQVNNWFINARRRILQPMLETTNSFLKNSKKAKLQHRNVAQNNWTNSVGVYSAYRTENMQQSTPSVAIVVSPTMVPQSSAVIVNLNDGQTQPVIISQPLQFVQVSQMPVQAVSDGCVNGSQSASTEVTTISTTQASIVVPLLHEKMTENLVAGLSES